jgi:hypothetical protein
VSTAECFCHPALLPGRRRSPFAIGWFLAPGDDFIAVLFSSKPWKITETV